MFFIWEPPSSEIWLGQEDQPVDETVIVRGQTVQGLNATGSAVTVNYRVVELSHTIEPYLPRNVEIIQTIVNGVGYTRVVGTDWFSINDAVISHVNFSGTSQMSTEDWNEIPQGGHVFSLKQGKKSDETFVLTVTATIEPNPYAQTPHNVKYTEQQVYTMHVFSNFDITARKLKIEVDKRRFTNV